MPICSREWFFPALCWPNFLTRSPRQSVQRWIAAAPAWLEIAESPAVTLSCRIHKGEAAATALASALHADLVLMDDRQGVLAAEQQGLNVTGTLGVLDLAAERNLIDFTQATIALKQTTFRMPLVLLNELLEKHTRGGNG